MKINEILTEYKIFRIEDNRARTDFKVIQNPNKIQFLNLLNGSENKNKIVRGLTIDNDVYIWIAYYATHLTVQEFLIRQGISGYNDIFMFGIDDRPNVDAKIWVYDRIVLDLDAGPDTISAPGFKRMIRGLNIQQWD